ncbi:gamma-glutamylcyclotransferase, partial [Burkholderia pseudomallei]|nr:gamma-glutamylcyclotransferase [Burkholderia pseudomallei]
RSGTPLDSGSRPVEARRASGRPARALDAQLARCR